MPSRMSEILNALLRASPLLTSFLLPVSAVVWNNQTLGLHDVSLCFVFWGYSMGAGTFGLYNETGFGPVGLTQIAFVAVCWTVLAIILTWALGVCQQSNIRLNWLATLLVAALVLQLVIPQVLTWGVPPSFSEITSIPIPAPSLCAMLSACVCSSQLRHERRATSI
ncbi:MAG: hypothetical protein HXY34_12615 [Candidatus Thorarchaeota archaeon]|nr:hypothetical protein [Candidatus Thorarchaeota archaeon]